MKFSIGCRVKNDSCLRVNAFLMQILYLRNAFVSPRWTNFAAIARPDVQRAMCTAIPPVSRTVYVCKDLVVKTYPLLVGREVASIY